MSRLALGTEANKVIFGRTIEIRDEWGKEHFNTKRVAKNKDKNGQSK